MGWGPDRADPPARNAADATEAFALDPRALATLRALDRGAGGVLREILELFVDDGYGLVLRIEEAVAARNPRRLRACARQLAGSAAHLGAADLVAVCLEIERFGARDQATAAAGTMDDLRKAFELVEAEVHDLLAEGH